MLANRTEQALGSLISEDQVGFVPGRQIGEKIMTMRAQQDLATQRGIRLYALFCDFEKAYDYIDRSFIYELRKFGFPDNILNGFTCFH